MSIAGGVSWEDVLEPLRQVSEIWVDLFIMYVPGRCHFFFGWHSCACPMSPLLQAYLGCYRIYKDYFATHQCFPLWTCPPPPPPPPPLPPPPPSLTHNFVTDNLVTHNSFTHNIVRHNSFTHNVVTRKSFTHTHAHNIVTHTTLSCTRHCRTQRCHTQLCHTHSVTHTTLSHATLSHTTV